MDTKARMAQLARELLRHQYLYYVAAQPEIPDSQYDSLFDELVKLEEQYPQWVSPNSPTRRVGSDLDGNFPEKPHTIPVLSLDKEYNPEGLQKWIDKTAAAAPGEIDFVVEEKIDGAAIVLYYKRGMLDAALTRGNGLVGNDVVDNIRTVAQVPLVLDEEVDLAVRGEIYIRKSDFITYNRRFEDRYSNPRNLAAGSLRNIKSSLVARIPLKILCYEGYFEEAVSNEHILVLAKLRQLNFRINRDNGFFSNRAEALARVRDELPGIETGKIADLVDYVQARMKVRDQLDYEIDGLVVKVNQIDVRRDLGYTAHHPRWATAFKFDAPSGETVVLDIRVQVGRNGRITPVAELEPVKIAGSTVARATLHNQEYIDMLELGLGDRVTVSKRGDIIPAVEKVIEKAPENPSVFKYPQTCPSCAGELVKDGGHHFCRNRECPERIKRGLAFFVARGQMDIDTLGEKTVDFLFQEGFVTSIPDLYRFDYRRLLDKEGFKDKKIENIEKSVQRSKEQPFERVLSSLGFDGLGKAAARDLVKNGFDSVDKIIAAAARGDVEAFTAIDGFAETSAQLLIEQFTDPQNLDLIARLKEVGLNFAAAAGTGAPKGDTFKDQVWVITGSFDRFNPRSKAAEEIESRGGKVSAAVSGKTTHLLAGSGAGSKLQKARDLGIAVIDEARFLEMLKG